MSGDHTAPRPCESGGGETVQAIGLGAFFGAVLLVLSLLGGSLGGLLGARMETTIGGVALPGAEEEARSTDDGDTTIATATEAIERGDSEDGVVLEPTDRSATTQAQPTEASVVDDPTLQSASFTAQSVDSVVPPDQAAVVVPEEPEAGDASTDPEQTSVDEIDWEAWARGVELTSQLDLGDPGSPLDIRDFPDEPQPVEPQPGEPQDQPAVALDEPVADLPPGVELPEGDGQDQVAAEPDGRVNDQVEPLPEGHPLLTPPDGELDPDLLIITDPLPPLEDGDPLLDTPQIPNGTPSTTVDDDDADDDQPATVPTDDPPPTNDSSVDTPDDPPPTNDSSVITPDDPPPTNDSSVDTPDDPPPTNDGSVDTPDDPPPTNDSSVITPDDPPPTNEGSVEVDAEDDCQPDWGLLTLHCDFSLDPNLAYPTAGLPAAWVIFRNALGSSSAATGQLPWQWLRDAGFGTVAGGRILDDPFADWAARTGINVGVINGVDWIAARAQFATGVGLTPFGKRYASLARNVPGAAAYLQTRPGMLDFTLTSGDVKGAIIGAGAYAVGLNLATDAFIPQYEGTPVTDADWCSKHCWNAVATGTGVSLGFITNSLRQGRTLPQAAGDGILPFILPTIQTLGVAAFSDPPTGEDSVVAVTAPVSQFLYETATEGTAPVFATAEEAQEWTWTALNNPEALFEQDRTLAFIANSAAIVDVLSRDVVAQVNNPDTRAPDEIRLNPFSDEALAEAQQYWDNLAYLGQDIADPYVQIVDGVAETGEIVVDGVTDAAGDAVDGTVQVGEELTGAGQRLWDGAGRVPSWLLDELGRWGNAIPFFGGTGEHLPFFGTDVREDAQQPDPPPTNEGSVDVPDDPPPTNEGSVDVPDDGNTDASPDDRPWWRRTLDCVSSPVACVRGDD